MLKRQRLYVNIDHVATVRQARRGDEPDPVAAAQCTRIPGEPFGVDRRIRRARPREQPVELLDILARFENEEVEEARGRRGHDR